MNPDIEYLNNAIDVLAQAIVALGGAPVEQILAPLKAQRDTANAQIKAEQDAASRVA